MPAFTRMFQIIAGLITVPIYSAAILGSAYGFPILNHIADVVHGANSQPVVSLNAPNWGFGIPILTPNISTLATTTATGGLASSTTMYFGVAALDGNGTTTMATSSVTTDAAGKAPEGIQITWAGVNGATGYAIYYGTAPNALSNYSLATTTGSFTLISTSTELAGSYTKQDTTAYTEMLQPNAPDWFNDNTPNATSSVAASTTGAEFGGTIDANASATTTACESDTYGSMFYNISNGHEWGCNASGWTKIF